MDFHPVADIFPLLQGEEYEILKADIVTNGLIEPIWLHPDGRIIDGRNRWRACADTNTNVTTRVWDGQGSLVSLVVSLNLHRRHLDSSQRAVVAVEVLPMLEDEARERQRQAGKENGRGMDSSVKDLTELSEVREPQRATQQAAEIFHTNRQYVHEAKNLKEKALDLFEQVKAGDMTIPKARREYKKRNRVEPPIPSTYKADGCHVVMGDAKKLDLSQFPHRYKVIVADPPWSYDVTIKQGTTEGQYLSLTDQDLFDMPVSDLAHADCVLFLWGTWPKLPQALEVIKAWGFKYVTGLPWIKTTVNGNLDYGVGYWVRGVSEYYLIAKRGNVSVEPLRMKGYAGLLWENLGHSRKPNNIHELAKALPGPYLELFARSPKYGWTVFGNDPALTQKVFV